MPGPLELFFRPHQKGYRSADVASGPKQFLGLTQLGSGSALVTVSTAVVKSDSLIMFSMNPATVGAVMNSMGPIVVNSIVDGVSFAMAHLSGATPPFTTRIAFEILNLK